MERLEDPVKTLRQVSHLLKGEFPLDMFSDIDVAGLSEAQIKSLEKETYKWRLYRLSSVFELCTFQSSGGGKELLRAAQICLKTKMPPQGEPPDIGLKRTFTKKAREEISALRRTGLAAARAEFNAKVEELCLGRLAPLNDYIFDGFLQESSAIRSDRLTQVAALKLFDDPFTQLGWYRNQSEDLELLYLPRSGPDSLRGIPFDISLSIFIRKRLDDKRWTAWHCVDLDAIVPETGYACMVRTRASAYVMADFYAYSIVCLLKTRAVKMLFPMY